MLSTLSSRIRRPSPALVVAVIALTLTAGGVGYATIPDSGDVIHACYLDRVGTLRVIDTEASPPQRCTRFETALNWNQGGGPPTGPAGGDLSGTYPNPSIASGAVDTSNFSGTMPAVRAFDTEFTVPGSHTIFIFPLAGEAYDTADLHSTATNTSRVVAPVTGVYRITANVRWEDRDPDGFRYLELTKNGVLMVEFSNLAPVAAIMPQSSHTQTLVSELKLSAGDFVELKGSQNSGSAIFAGASSFTMSWVAPG